MSNSHITEHHDHWYAHRFRGRWNSCHPYVNHIQRHLNLQSGITENPMWHNRNGPPTRLWNLNASRFQRNKMFRRPRYPLKFDNCYSQESISQRSGHFNESLSMFPNWSHNTHNNPPEKSNFKYESPIKNEGPNTCNNSFVNDQNPMTHHTTFFVKQENYSNVPKEYLVDDHSEIHNQTHQEHCQSSADPVFSKQNSPMRNNVHQYSQCQDDSYSPEEILKLEVKEERWSSGHENVKATQNGKCNLKVLLFYLF